jgi:hypothetical protein
MLAWCLLAGLFAISPGVATAAGNSVPDFLQKLRERFVNQLHQDDADVLDSQHVLDRAQAAYDKAVADHDAVNTDIASHAIDFARQALERAKENRERDRDRLAAVNRAMSWPDPGTRYAVPLLVQGQVMETNSSGVEAAYDSNSPLLPGETLNVGPNSALEFQSSDGTLIKLGHDTSFQFESDDKGSIYKLLRGYFRSQRACFPTPTAIMGVLGCNGQPRYEMLRFIAAVRGTDFAVEANGNNAVIAVYEGSVEVGPSVGGEKVVVNEGQKLLLPGTGPLSAPVPLKSK